MTTTINALQIRHQLGRSAWSAPTPFGPDGWKLLRLDGTGSVIVTASDHGGAEWVHASIAWHSTMPTYADLKALHAAVFGTGWAYQVFAPPSDHVNIHEFALHLFGRLDGLPVLPDFTEGTGSI
jgi:hypothetical protein